MKIYSILCLSLFFSISIGFSQEQMTADRFREIVSTPGDNVPLTSKLATGSPVWTNAMVNIALKYTDGRTVQENSVGTAKTIGGKYAVFTVQSKLYNQPMSCIRTYDEKASALKLYALYGETVIESIYACDNEKKIYAASSAYGDGYSEITIGSYSDTESSDRTLVYKNGVLFMTRDVNSHQIMATK